MRKLFSFLGMLMLCATMMAQTPSAFKYQAVARNLSGEVMANKPMTVRISILKGAQVEYSEVHSVTTNDLGLFSIEVGRGSPVSGTFFDIVWSDDPHFIRVEMDPSGGNNFMFIGISELLSVPYAQHAETVTNNDDADADPNNEIQDLKVAGNFLRITKNPNPTQIDLSQFDTDDQQVAYDVDQHILTLQNGGSVNLESLEDDADADPTNELQTVTQVGSIVSLSQGGGTFTVDDADANPINELQTLSQNGNTISLSQGGGSVTITENDGSPTNEIQDLSFNNNYLYITGKPHPTIVNLNPLMDNTDAQQLSFDSQTGNLALDNGGLVNLSSLEDDADANPTNELQTISRVGDDLVLSQNGGTVNIQDSDSNPTNEIQTVSQNGLTVTLSQGGGTFSVADDDNSPVNEIQDLMMFGDSLYITNNPGATAINIGAVDNQTLNFSNSTYELTIANGNTVDLSDLKDDDDSNPINEIQDLYLSNDSLVITSNPWATVIDMSPYMDNTDAQTLGLAANTLSISGGNSVNLTSYLDNTDAQTLSLAGNNLSITGGNTVNMSAFKDNTDAQTLSIVGMNLSITGGNTVAIPSSADNLGNHTATQNIQIGPHYMSNDGDDEGIRITTDGNVTASNGLFVGENATTNSDLYISGRMYDWDNFSYYVDPDFQSHVTDLRVDAGVIVNTGGITVSAGGMNVTGNASFVNNATVGGTLGVTGNTTMSNASMSGTLGVTGNTTMSNASLSGTLGVTGNTTMSNASMSGTLGVTGATTLSSTLAVTGNATMNGKLDVANATTLSSTLAVTGNTTMSNATMSGTLGVTGATTLSSTLVVTGNTTVGGTFGVTGNTSMSNASLSGTLGVTGNSTMSNASLSGTLDVTGNTSMSNGTMSGTLDVTGATTLASTLAVAGNSTMSNATMSGTLAVTGNTTMSNASLSGTLDVTGNTSMSNATMSGTLAVTGVSTLSDNLSVHNGDIDIDDAKAFYFGDKATDGSWRIVRIGNDLSFERMELGVWVQKDFMTP